MKDNEKAEAPALKAFIGKKLFGKKKKPTHGKQSKVPAAVKQG